ncbi:MAG: hypothetical protein QM730_04065 [Anaerolineales bacterium]
MSRQKPVTILMMLIAVAAILLSAERFLYRRNWEKETSPLPRETIDKLCKSLSLDESEQVCNPSKRIYAYDFSQVLREYFPLEDAMETPKNSATITFQQVENIIGEYKIKCQEVVDLPASGYSYFRCFYDLRGDDYWIDTFYFYYPEETLFSIRSGSSSND